MSVKQYVEEIFQALQGLPAEKLAKVRDLALALKEENAADDVDIDDAWTDEDLRDFTAMSCDYANETIEWDE